MTADLKELQTTLLLAGRNSGPDLLFDWSERGELTPEHVRTLLPRVWADVEFPGLWGVKRWLRLFKFAGFVTDGLARPAEPIRVYRGCSATTVYRLAWTSDQEKAQWFAERLCFFDYNGLVYTGICPPKHVLALLGDRNESEVVVNPWGLRDVYPLPTSPEGS